MWEVDLGDISLLGVAKPLSFLAQPCASSLGIKHRAEKCWQGYPGGGGGGGNNKN